MAGGTGAAKFLRGFAPLVGTSRLTVIGNTGDDVEVWGLHVSPDLDTVMYTLAGLIDEAKGWGVRSDTFQVRDAMGRLGGETWFNLGDRDLATHILRTKRLRQGWTLSRVTDELCRVLGTHVRILPMSDQPVRTRILTPEGWIGFQEFFVKNRAKDEVLEVTYGGAEAASPTPGVLEALAAAEAIIVCPSNPVTSIGPILAIPGVLEALKATRARVAAVSPIVGGVPVSGPAGKLMAMRGLPVSAVGVAQAYREWLDVLVMDRQDATLVPAVEALGVRAEIAQTLMTTNADAGLLGRAVLGALGTRP